MFGKQPPRWSPMILTFLTSTPLCRPLPHGIGYHRNDRMWLLRIVHKRHCGFYLVLKDHLVWESQPPCQEGTQTVVWGGEEVRPPATGSTNSPAMWVSHLTIRFSDPSQAFRWLQPSQHNDCNLMRDPSQNNLAKLLPSSWFTETCKMVFYCCCFKPLSLGVTFYAAIGNQYSLE